MGIKGFLHFVEKQCPKACQRVDLLDISRGSSRVGSKKKSRTPLSYGVSTLSLVVDAESCLDRLYGGYFPDWICGGQWNNTLGFLTHLMQACRNSNLQLVIFFNGGLEGQRHDEWKNEQIEVREKVIKIMRHVQMKGTPPPKIWWLPPACVASTLRLIFRHLVIPVCCSMDDHHQEVIAYCRENVFQGVVAEDPEYAIFDPPRMFSAHYLKLKFSGQLETVEYVMDEVAKCLDLHPHRFCVTAALLGNFILPEGELYEFFCRCLNRNPKVQVELPESEIFMAVINFVRSLPDIDDLTDIGLRVFCDIGESVKKERIARLKHCVQYYMNGTKEGFLKYFPRPQVFMAPLPTVHHRQPGAYRMGASEEFRSEEVAESAAEIEASHASIYQEYSKDESGYGTMPTLPTPAIVIEEQKKEKSEESLAEKPVKSESESAKLKLGDPHKLSSISSSSSSSDASSPQRLSPESTWSQFPAKKVSSVIKDKPLTVSSCNIPYHVPPEIIRIASERHQKGLMMPWVYQVITQAEIKLPVCLEDSENSDLPCCAELYADLRQHVYGILLAYSKPRKPKEKAETVKDLTVKEWHLSSDGKELTYDTVSAKPLGWQTPTPTIRQLWLGQKVEDKNRRLRAFLTCMGSDYTPLMLNTTYVPQRLLVMCAVLRYMMLYEKTRVLRQYELDAFLVQSVSPMFITPHHLAEIQLPSINIRAIHLSTLFMQGVEAAIFANDGCGAPIPWMMCCPWMFFDGRLFQMKLLKASSGASLHELCDGQVELVMRVERMRQAILEGIRMEFAAPKLMFSSPSILSESSAARLVPAGASLPQQTMRGRGRGMLSRGRGFIGGHGDPFGAELQVAGVVVGSWGGHLRGLPPPRKGSRRGGYAGFFGPQPSYRGSSRTRGMSARMPMYMTGPRTPFSSHRSMRGLGSAPSRHSGRVKTRNTSLSVRASIPRGAGRGIRTVERAEGSPDSPSRTAEVEQGADPKQFEDVRRHGESKRTNGDKQSRDDVDD